MQYHIQTLVKHLFDKDSFEQVTVQELKQFTDDYPFAAVGQFLYAKKLKESGSYNHYEMSEQASLYFHNALWLRWQLEQKEEAPVLPVKAEEPAQQPGFRIVVQMPKTAPAVLSTLPANQPAPPLAPAASHQETTEEPVQAIPPPPEEVEERPAAEAATPVPDETVAEEHGNTLQVNEDGSLVVKEAEQAPAPEEASPVAETGSAVAIAENSQLAEESTSTEAPVNAVSITSAIFTPAPVAAENTTPPTSGEATVNEERDDIIPAVEVPAEIADTKTVQEEIDEIIPAVEVTPDAIEAAAAADIAPEEQPVEQVIATVATEEQAPFTAETEQPVTAEEVVDNTTDNQPPAAVEEQPVQAKPEGDSGRPPAQTIISTPGNQEGQTTVDLGEPIFESYHTIDYFASQGIKLMQEDFKDKMGKQLKSFTDWLRSMKRIGPMEQNTSLDEVTNQSIQRIAAHSVEEKEVVTEAMAEVWAKQGNARKAIRVYEKLSLLNPDKSTYFASRIEQLKAL